MYHIPPRKPDTQPDDSVVQVLKIVHKQFADAANGPYICNELNRMAKRGWISWEIYTHVLRIIASRLPDPKYPNCTITLAEYSYAREPNGSIFVAPYSYKLRRIWLKDLIVEFGGSCEDL